MKNHITNYSKEFIKYLNTLGTAKENEPLKNYTSFKTGGPADILVLPKNMNSVPEIIRAVKKEKIQLTVIGGCSNLLIADNGIRGLVLKIDTKQSDSLIDISDGLIYCSAGVSKEYFIDCMINEGFGGIEFMVGIPGCMGGGIIMNAGTNLGAFIDILWKVEIVDKDGVVNTVKADKKMSSYRKFSMDIDGVVTGCHIKLKKSHNPLETKNRVNDILKERSGKHPLDFPSAGSVFKNPEGNSSWKLIDNAGLKGKVIGGAMVSPLHTNFIVNSGNAKSIDIKMLIESIQEIIYSKHNIKLETEIRMIGEF